MGGICAGEGNGKSRSVSPLQPSVRAHLVRIQEASLGLCRPKAANIGLRSQYALRLYSWAQRYLTAGTKRISLEQLRKVLGLESVKDADGNIIQEAPLAVWANLRQRALDTAIAEINRKTDLNIALESLGRSKHRRVTTLTFSIKAQAVPNGD
jgi:plasmid replication initiation protein